MGWSGATSIFDNTVRELLKLEITIDVTNIISALFTGLRENDWDTTYDSNFIDNPVVRDAIIMSEPEENWQLYFEVCDFWEENPNAECCPFEE